MVQSHVQATQIQMKASLLIISTKEMMQTYNPQRIYMTWLAKGIMT